MKCGSPKCARLLATCCYALAFQGCSDGRDSFVVELENETVFGMSWEEYKREAKAAAKGEDYYLVEWDVVLGDEEALRTHFEELVLEEESKLAVFQQTSTGLEPVFSAGDALDIAYCISNSFTNKTTVTNDLAAATAAWEQTVNVRFRYVSAQDASCNQNNANVDFAVVPSNSGPTGCAINKLTWTALRGCQVDTASDVKGVLVMRYSEFPIAGADSGITPVAAWTHELGHMLGFRHEHPWAPSGGGCSEEPTNPFTDRTGRRLTPYDQLSVMHYPSCGGIAGADLKISQLDGEGARTVYGMPAAWYIPLL